MPNRPVTPKRENTPLNQREHVYSRNFALVQYAYGQGDRAHLDFAEFSRRPQPQWHVSILDVKQWIEYFNLQEISQRQGSAISFETERLSLPVGSSVNLELEAHNMIDPLGTLYITAPTREVRCYPQVSIAEVSHYIFAHLSGQVINISAPDIAFKPRVSTVYRARLMRGEFNGKAVWCVIEDEVKYFVAAKPKGAELYLAEEDHARVYWLTTPHDIVELKTLPLSSRFWMGEYHYKRLHRYPCFNELPDYEYEAKLSPETLRVDESLLPYPVIERYQTESIRWYRNNDERVGFREGRASIVQKGKKVKLGLILKREEQKTQGLSTWSISEEDEGLEFNDSSQIMNQMTLKMRRIKRQLYLLNPKSQRVYALCLDYCYVSDLKVRPLLQVELEYNGKLCIPLEQLQDPEWLSVPRQIEAARELGDQHPKAARRCIERALIISKQSASHSERHELKTFQTLLHEKLQKVESITKQGLNPCSQGKKKEHRDEKDVNLKLDSIEQDILEEMSEVIHSLIDRQDFVPTRLTKRKWLKNALES